MAALMLVAWLRGGPWERLGTATFIVGCLIAGLLQDRGNILEPQYGYLASDIFLFVAFTAIALRSRLWWATWAAGFQLFGISIQMAVIVADKVAAYAYYLGIGLYTYLILAAIMVGAWTHKRE